MAQMLTRGTTPTAPTGVITVADLLSRYAPAPVADPEPVTAPVSVGSLLRREGRAPHSLDRPLQPRASQVRAEQAVELLRADDRYEDDEDEPRRGAGILVRRGAIAAGVLVAAGSVFGAAVVDDASSRSDADTQAQGSYPGQGRLDPAPAEAVPTVVDPAGLAALSEALDPGEAPSASWMEMAGGSGSPDAAPTGPTSGGAGGSTQEQGAIAPLSTDANDDEPTGGNAGGGDTGGGPPAGGDDTPSGGGAGPGGGSGGGPSNPTPPLTNPTPAGGLGGAVQGVGGAVPGPLGGAVEGVGGAVGSLGNGVQSATGGDDEDPGLVGNVGRLAGSLL